MILKRKSEIYFTHYIRFSKNLKIRRKSGRNKEVIKVQRTAKNLSNMRKTAKRIRML